MAIVPSNNLSGNMFHILNLTQTETVFCTAPNHKLAGEQIFTNPMIQNEPLILFHNGFFPNDVITQLFSKYGAVPNVIHYSSQLYTMKEFITGGIACGFLAVQPPKDLNYAYIDGFPPSFIGKDGFLILKYVINGDSLPDYIMYYSSDKGKSWSSKGILQVPSVISSYSFCSKNTVYIIDDTGVMHKVSKSNDK